MKWVVASLALVLGSALASSTLALPSHGFIQDEVEESGVQKYLRLAREGRAVVRPQAARRLLELRPESTQALLEAAGEDGEGLASLGKDIVGVLGEFENETLRRHLWSALADADFPWRPDAASSLATTASPSEVKRFRTMLADPIARVRVAALTAFRLVEFRPGLPDIRACLVDQSDRVRREAAALLADWGEPCSLYWLIEDLARRDRFFSLQTGNLARYEALSLLSERLDSVHDYSTRKDPEDPANLAAIAAMRDELARRCESKPELPALAQAGDEIAGNVLGLEVRSCRRGEFFLRWNVDDTLLVGTGNPARIQLPKGTVAKLLESASHLTSQLQGQFWGEPGCDLEQLHYQPDAESRPRAFRVNKGPVAIEGLRPKELGELAQLLCRTLPKDANADARLDRLSSRVHDALLRVGGPLPDLSFASD